MRELTKEFFAAGTLSVARKLLGAEISYNGCRGIIVETEAYKTDDASHYNTRRHKAKAIIETYGHLYIYLNYGMYHLLNFTTEKTGIGAVLIRAVEPLEGIESMQEKRNTTNLMNLANGPGKLCQAFGIGSELNAEVVGQSLTLYHRKRIPDMDESTRIGITKATELMWRFFIKDNKYVSKYKAAKL